jgi:hypothetical protein
MLHEQVVRTGPGDDVERLGGDIEEEARDVDRVDCLDQQLDPGLLQAACRKAQVGDKRFFQHRALNAGRGAMPAMQLTCLQPSAVA